jgi:dihydroorotase
MMRTVLPYTTGVFRAALIMPNTDPPILTDREVAQYRKEITEAIPRSDEFLPLMTFLLTPGTTRDDIGELAQIRPRVVGKLLPKNLTTNSEHGVENPLSFFEVFRFMEIHGIPLSIHGELAGDSILGRNREKAFLPILRLIAASFPKLKIILEHVTTAAAVDTVLSLGDNVAATITVHHLLLTTDDVCGDKLAPALWCKPIPKDPKDRDALVRAATSGCPKFMFGSDSAPHPKTAKHAPFGCRPGAFTAPVALPLLMEIFERQDALDDRLGFFVFRNPRNFYDLKELLSTCQTITMVRNPCTVPTEIDGIFLFWGGREISWQIQPEEN